MESKSKQKINWKLPPGATPLDAEDLEGLIPLYITTRKELNDAEFKNIAEASKFYLLSDKKFVFSRGNLYKAHKKMFGQVWKWAGKRRITNKNIGVDKTQIDVEIKKLMDDINYWLSHEMNTIEISARIHHRLVFIHPFNNGNGRWARLIVNIFLGDHLNSFLAFPEESLLLSTDIRKTYFLALKDGDNLHYKRLIDFHEKYISTTSI
jgi:Fic-DOC domain mobile mystery protein B